MIDPVSTGAIRVYPLRGEDLSGAFSSRKSLDSDAIRPQVFSRDRVGQAPVETTQHISSDADLKTLAIPQSDAPELREHRYELDRIDKRELAAKPTTGASASSYALSGRNLQLANPESSFENKVSFRSLPASQRSL